MCVFVCIKQNSNNNTTIKKLNKTHTHTHTYSYMETEIQRAMEKPEEITIFHKNETRWNK